MTEASTELEAKAEKDGLPEAELLWRTALKVGDVIDCYDVNCHWLNAEIVSLHPHTERTAQVSRPKLLDEWIPVRPDGGELINLYDEPSTGPTGRANYRKHCMAVGDRVRVIPAGRALGVVRAVKTGGTTALVHFSGWESRWDEFVDTMCPRVQPFLSHTVAARCYRQGGPDPNAPTGQPEPHLWQALHQRDSLTVCVGLGMGDRFHPPARLLTHKREAAGARKDEAVPVSTSMEEPTVRVPREEVEELFFDFYGSPHDGSRADALDALDRTAMGAAGATYVRPLHSSAHAEGKAFLAQMAAHKAAISTVAAAAAAAAAAVATAPAAATKAVAVAVAAPAGKATTTETAHFSSTTTASSSFSSSSSVSSVSSESLSPTTTPPALATITPAPAPLLSVAPALNPAAAQPLQATPAACFVSARLWRTWLDHHPPTQHPAAAHINAPWGPHAETALHQAVQAWVEPRPLVPVLTVDFRPLIALQALLDAGADVNALNRYNQTPLHLAATLHSSGLNFHTDRLVCLGWLIVAGAWSSLCLPDVGGRTPLVHAALHVNEFPRSLELLELALHDCYWLCRDVLVDGMGMGMGMPPPLAGLVLEYLFGHTVPSVANADGKILSLQWALSRPNPYVGVHYPVSDEQRAAVEQSLSGPAPPPPVWSNRELPWFMRTLVSDPCAATFSTPSPSSTCSALADASAASQPGRRYPFLSSDWRWRCFPHVLFRVK